jgi:broad specificity phosphatase PhoE
MALIYIIRHGKAAGSFTDDLDPGLDALGVKQAEAACTELARHLPLALRTSPLKRARETALALVASTGQDITVEDRFAEIPSPGLSLAERGPWLREIMAGNWQDQDQSLRNWQRAMVDCMLEIKEDTAIFSHYVAINAAVGAVTGDERVLVFRPDNCSITIIETDGKSLRLVQQGAEAETHVN